MFNETSSLSGGWLGGCSSTTVTEDNHAHLCTFYRLNRVKGLPANANTHTWSLPELLSGNYNEVVLSNYMTDLWWLYSVCPRLRRVPVTVITGDGTKSKHVAERNVTWHVPKLPIAYGTHHSKAMLVFYDTGVRVVICTANFIAVDWLYKNQGIWCQDFPLKTPESPTTSVFEDDLVAYFTQVGGFDSSKLRNYDFSNATVHLIASVPGYHRNTAGASKKCGLGGLKKKLENVNLPEEYWKAETSSVICQYSSLGSLDEKWVSEQLLPAVLSGKSRYDQISGIKGGLMKQQPKLKLVFPTTEEVRQSVEGWRAGVSIPVPNKNNKPFLRSFRGRDLMHKFFSPEISQNITDTPMEYRVKYARQLAMPHIKTYCRVDERGGTMAWFAVTSSNLSKAAWGEWQKKAEQLMVRSYELGVLFDPALYASTAPQAVNFTCTPLGPKYPWDEKCMQRPPLTAENIVFATPWSDLGALPSTKIPVLFQIPYSLPPAPYTKSDIPWANDIFPGGRDSLGKMSTVAYGSTFYGPEGIGDFRNYALDWGLDEGDDPAQGVSFETSEKSENEVVTREINEDVYGGTSSGESLDEIESKIGEISEEKQGEGKRGRDMEKDGFSEKEESGEVVKGEDRSDGSAKRHKAAPVVWYWLTDSHRWQAYSPEYSSALESAYLRFSSSQSDVRVNVGGGRHVDLREMRQIVTSHPARRRKVKRGDGSE